MVTEAKHWQIRKNPREKWYEFVMYLLKWNCFYKQNKQVPSKTSNTAILSNFLKKV